MSKVIGQPEPVMIKRKGKKPLPKLATPGMLKKWARNNRFLENTRDSRIEMVNKAIDRDRD